MRGGEWLRNYKSSKKPQCPIALKVESRQISKNNKYDIFHFDLCMATLSPAGHDSTECGVMQKCVELN